MAATITGVLREVRQYRSTSSGDITAKIVIEFPGGLPNLEVIQELNKIACPEHLVKVVVVGEDEWDDVNVRVTKDRTQMKVAEAKPKGEAKE